MISRWGYADAADVQDKWHQFRDRQIPVDAFIYDYDWFHNDWDFNPKTFPPGSLDKMKALGLHFVGIRKPRVTGANLDYARQSGLGPEQPAGDRPALRPARRRATGGGATMSRWCRRAWTAGGTTRPSRRRTSSSRWRRPSGTAGGR